MELTVYKPAKKICWSINLGNVASYYGSGRKSSDIIIIFIV